jgi:hypothetical protein
VPSHASCARRLITPAITIRSPRRLGDQMPDLTAHTSILLRRLPLYKLAQVRR